MTPEITTLIADLNQKVFPNMAEEVLSQLVRRIADRSTDPDLRATLRSLLTSDKYEDAYLMNVLSAGLFAIIPGSKYMFPGDSNDVRVNVFLHRLRKSLLACTVLDSKRRENSTKYNFYPEFLTIGLSQVRPRVAAIAKAHSKMGPGNDELTVLYSLGGYFPLVEAAKAVHVDGPKHNGGTTCIMTARAIYQAAGLNMIGQRPPTFNTPGGTIDLGVPMTKASKLGKKWDEATVLRADQLELGRPFNDVKDPIPNIEPGDIYMIDGHGKHQFLLRGNGALAVHVGVVVARAGLSFTTVDGGSGNGANVDINPRNLTHKDGVGWTFGDSRAYSGEDNTAIDTYMTAYVDDAAVVNWLATTKGQEPNYRNYQKTKATYDKAVAEGKTDLAKMLKKPVDMQLAQFRKLIKIIKGGKTGEVRTIHGWWKPEHYTELRYAGRESLKSWLN